MIPVEGHKNLFRDPKTNAIINKDKLILNLKYIFPNKDYDLIKKKNGKKEFFLF